MKLISKTVGIFLTLSCASFVGCVTSNNDDDEEAATTSSMATIVIQKTDHKDSAAYGYKSGYLVPVQIGKGGKSGEKMLSSLATGNCQVSAEEAKKYLNNRPKDLTALSVLTTALAVCKKYDAAAFFANLIQKYYPGKSETLNIKALAIVMAPNNRTADFLAAADLFQQAFDASQTEVASGLNLGYLHLELGNAKAALDAFQAVSTRCGDCSQARVGFGIASSRLHRFDKAQQAFETVLDREPDNFEAMFLLALVEKTGFKDREKAAKLLRHVVAEAPPQAKDIRAQAEAMLNHMQG